MLYLIPLDDINDIFYFIDHGQCRLNAWTCWTVARGTYANLCM